MRSSRAGAIVLAALIPLAVLGLDPAGWYWFGPVKWLVVSALVPLGAAIVLWGRPLRLVTRPAFAAGTAAITSAMPKSARRGEPSDASSTLDGFTSR